ncbi:Ribonuclease/ribotoxin [Hypoxylon fuscum]|nr:Ribonuclease/ribotoxin [Hypoxylon fuscum]
MNLPMQVGSFRPHKSPTNSIQLLDSKLTHTMSTIRFVGLLAMMSVSVLASPFRNETFLAKRRTNGYNCGGQTYTLVQANDAWGDGISLRRANSQKSGYPKEFRNGQAGNPEVEPSPCAGLQLYEFPILASGAEYNGGDPAADRAVFADSNSSPGSYEQCFLMTHTGASGNLFVKCSTT